MVVPDTSLVAGILAAIVLLVLNAGIARLRLCRLVEGTPTLLVLYGQVISAHLRREGVDQETLKVALREPGRLPA